MKAVILCGGKGTRLAEETELRPKPLVEIGEYPILWHIMKGLGAHGIKDFGLALGYKGDQIKDYFLNYHRHARDLSLNVSTGNVQMHDGKSDDWNVTLINTGQETQTGGRLKRLKDFIGDDTWFMTYGDGVSNVNISELLSFHRKHGKLATVTAVHPPARFGELFLENDEVKSFKEKPQTEHGWINGGYFVLESKVLDYIEGDNTVWEKVPMERLSSEGQLMAYRHNGFWQCMDTMRDKRLLEGLWHSNKAPWKGW